MNREPVRVLYVEDDPLDAFVLDKTLRDTPGIETHYIVTHATDLFTGLEYFQNETFDVVLLDMNLPEGQGEKNIIIFKKHAPFTPIICLTGTDSDALALNAVRAGAQDYVVKNFGNAHVLNRVILSSICRQEIENKNKKIEIPEDKDFLPVQYQTPMQLTKAVQYTQ